MGDIGREAATQQLLETPAAELAARRAQIQAHAEAAGFSAEEIQEILNSRADLPRALLPEERDALLLSFERLDETVGAELRAQVAATKVNRYSCPCPCASVGLVVDKTKVAPARVSEALCCVGDVSIKDPDGESLGGVSVDVKNGYLSTIEIWWYEEPISPIPPREQLVVVEPTNQPSRSGRSWLRHWRR